MNDEPSKYAENQFHSATRGRPTLMTECIAYTKPRIAAAALLHPGLVAVHNAFLSAAAAWDAADSVVANAEAGQTSATFAFESKITSLTRKPDDETNSPLESWDNIIVSQVAVGGTTYRYLLPNGRETITVGSYEQRLKAIEDFSVRLKEQTAKPQLVTLGGTVATFWTDAVAKRDFQANRKSALDTGRIDLDGAHDLVAGALFGMVGASMTVWSATPAMVDSLFDVNLLLNPAQVIPEPPIDTTWTPATRTMSTTAMPVGATSIEAWREGPGGMPERLALGERGALEIVIPANITFDPGDMYQLWLQGRNSKGTSAPGPKQSWEAE